MFIIGQVFADLDIIKIETAWNVNIVKMHFAEGPICSFSIKQMPFKLSQSLHDRTCAGVSSLIKKLFIKKRLQHRSLPMSFEKFLIKPIW